MSLDIVISFIAIIYLYFIIGLKNTRKIRIFLSKYLNVSLILILIILSYQINQNISVILLIMFLFTKYFIGL